jgi:uncharacterized membrane protein HdeD (DUF308 family)
MDGWANSYWTIILTFILAVYLGIQVLILGIIQFIKKKKGRKSTLLKNIFYVLIAYLLFAIPTTLFVSQIGFLLSITALPVLAAITLIILEVMSIFKK